MAQYIVKKNQNIFDIAIELYGSVEGIYDLLITNSWLSMEYDLKAGDVLEYHDYFVLNQGIVDEIRNKNYRPANGARHVYAKNPSENQVFQIHVQKAIEFSAIIVSGEGTMLVDWGDNSELQTINLTHTEVKVEHFFDNQVDKRIIRIFGNFSLLTFDATELNGNLYTLYPVVVDEFTSKSNEYSLEGLFLFSGTVVLNLTGMLIKDLSPIYNMSLQELDLRGAHFEPEVIDDYLVNIVNNYGTRRNCTVYLTTEPTATGMAAIQTIINDSAWNQSGAWVFNINGTIYTAS
jgi:hypothetical protein